MPRVCSPNSRRAERRGSPSSGSNRLARTGVPILGPEPRRWPTYCVLLKHMSTASSTIAGYSDPALSRVTWYEACSLHWTLAGDRKTTRHPRPCWTDCNRASSARERSPVWLPSKTPPFGDPLPWSASSSREPGSGLSTRRVARAGSTGHAEQEITDRAPSHEKGRRHSPQSIASVHFRCLTRLTARPTEVPHVPPSTATTARARPRDRAGHSLPLSKKLCPASPERRTRPCSRTVFEPLTACAPTRRTMSPAR
jgi:hypothetical protein